jgi:hypothetical protein
LLEIASTPSPPALLAPTAVQASLEPHETLVRLAMSAGSVRTTQLEPKSDVVTTAPRPAVEVPTATQCVVDGQVTSNSSPIDEDTA